MKQYVLSVYQPDGPPPASVDLDRIRRDLDVLNDEMRAEGAWVFSGGLHPPSSATVVRMKGDELLMSDGRRSRSPGNAAERDFLERRRRSL